MALPSLAEWETFYVIIGSSGAALTGLMFVVVALAAERSGAPGGDSMTAFGTPTILYFGMVLLVASVATMPRRTVLSLSLCILVGALVGLIYTTVGIARMRRQKDYTPVREDWFWHAVMPLSAYALLLVASLVLLVSPEQALYLIAGVVLFMLYIGVRNAWDAAVYVATSAQKS